MFLGAVYAGCCYAPMDGTMPVHRLNSIFNTLDTDLMIVQRAFYDKARTLEFGGEILIAEDLLDNCEDAALLADCRARARELRPAVHHLHPSGSTGTPKGVITAQHSLMCYIEDYAGVMGIAREDVLGNQSPLDYIAAVRDIYLPLRFGATTAIIEGTFMSPERLFEYMNDKGVTAVGWSVSALTVPAALGAFECSVPQHLRKVCFSGSVMPCSCLRQWQLALPQARFVNQYGPTEATAFVHVLRRARSGGGHRRAADRQAVPALRGVSALRAKRGRARRRDPARSASGAHPRARLLQQPRENGRELPAKPAQPRV